MARTKVTKGGGSYTDAWLLAVQASDLHPSTRCVAFWLSRFADWNTGRDCWPSRPTLARLASLSEATAKRALTELEAAGYIERTNVKRQRNSTDYRLTLPPSVGSESPISQVTHDLTGEIQSGHPRSPVGSPMLASQVTHDLQPPQTSSDRREDEGGGAHSLTRPEGSTLIALATDAAAEILAAALPDREPWSLGVVNAADPKLLAVLADWAAAGRSVESLRDACANLGKPKSDPTRLLVAHIGRAVSEPIPRLVRPSVTAGQGQDTQPAATKTQKPKKPKTSEPPTIPADFGDDAPSVCAELVEDGAQVSVAGDGIEAAGKGWRVAWKVGGRPELTTADARIRAAVLDELIGSSEDGNAIRFGENALAFYELASTAMAVA